MEDDNFGLQQELEAQRRVADDVRGELAGFVAEVRTLAAQSDKSLHCEEELRRQVQDLESELQQWKSRYARAKQATNGNAASVHLAVQPPSLDSNRSFERPDGHISTTHVAQFQIGVDELLRASRAGDPRTLLTHMKAVVVAVRDLSEDAKDVPAAAKARARITATANNFITAARNFASAPSVSPDSLLDAAASHLAAAMVELARTVGVQPSSDTDADDEHHNMAYADNHVVRPPPAAMQHPGPDDDEDDDTDIDMGAYNDAGSRYTSIDAGRSSASNSVYSLGMAAAVPANHGRKPSAKGSINAIHMRNVSRSGPNAHARKPSAALSAVSATPGEPDEEIVELKVRSPNTTAVCSGRTNEQK